MMRTTIDHTYTANGRYMLDQRTRDDVTSGINQPSDAIITAETSLYRAAHAFITKNGVATKLKPEQAFQSPWWSTYYDFNQVAWATNAPDLSEAARDAFAIHRGWGGDCALYASIVTRCDLSVWYGLGKNVEWPDQGSAQVSIAFASQEILQIYIPGFRDNAQKWSTFHKVLPFERNLTNGRGFQGMMPHGLRSGGAQMQQMKLF